ncbi:hypothetical protein [Streptomyces alfalfae]
MPNLIKIALPFVSLAITGAALQSGTAFAASPGSPALLRAEQPARAAQADEWTLPPDYTFERLVPVGGESGCRVVGDEGIDQGKWNDYICRVHKLPYQDPWGWPSGLYVKK